MATSLMSRFKLAALAGLSFGGKRNLYDVFGYPKALTFDQLYMKYQRQDLAGRVVDMPAEETWSSAPIITLPSSTGAWEDFILKVGLWDRIIQADKLCSFGKFAVLWLGLPGDQSKAAPKIQKKEDFLYLQAYGGDNVTVKMYEERTTSERYGQPVLYEIKVGPQEGQTKTIRVHYSRVIHIVDRPLQGSMFGEPRLALVYNVLDDLLKIGGGSAELYWLTANRGMQVDIDKEMQLDQADADALSDELDEFQHQLRRYIRTRGVKITTLGSEVADPRGVFQTLMSILAGATSIPQRILTGSEAGQLASEQDRANWATYIERRRKTFAEPYVLRPTLQKLEDLGYFQAEEAQKATYKWPEAFKTNPIEESNIRANDGRALVNYSRRAQFGNPLITDEEVRRRLGLPDKPLPGETMPETPVKATTSPAKGDSAGSGGTSSTSGPGASPGASPTETDPTLTGVKP